MIKEAYNSTSKNCSIYFSSYKRQEYYDKKELKNTKITITTTSNKTIILQCFVKKTSSDNA
jgi:hypothetical protein